MARKYIDCREMPSESGCDLTISGSEAHVLDAAVVHAVTAHGHANTPELREQMRGGLKEETAGIHA
jgi:predicted small metal-binding protein